MDFASKERAKFKRWLSQVNKTGNIGKVACETLLINGAIEISPPNAKNRYNHWELTSLGKEWLATGVFPV